MRTLTVSSYQKDGEQIFSNLQARRLMRVSNRSIWRAHLKAIGINPDNEPRLTWTDIKNLLALQLFLRARNGVHSVYQFSRIFREGLMETAIARFQIDLDVVASNKKPPNQQSSSFPARINCNSTSS